jgi:transcriptional regulator with XRE-family HTH domain
MARPRKVIDDKLEGFPERFAVRIRALMERHGWTAIDVAKRISALGLTIGPRAVDAWLRAEKMPRLKDIEVIGTALDFRDYRDLLPPPRKQ